MLSKNAFVHALSVIRKHEAQLDRLHAIYSEMTQGVGVIAMDSLVQDALINTLKDGMDDQGEWIEWWLYEAPQDEKIVSWKEDGKPVEVDLAEPSALYDFLVKAAGERSRKVENGQKNDVGKSVP